MRLAFIAFLLSLTGLSFAIGLAVGAYEIPPYQQLKFVLNSVEAVIADRSRFTSDLPTSFISERRYEGSGVTVYDKTRATDGYTLLSGFFEDLPEVRLIDMEGSVVRRWPVSYHSLFSNSDHVFPKEKVPATDWNVAVHGIHIEPDGSILFNLDGKGTVKMDRCGGTVWTLSRMTHHSIDKSADGNFWIPSRNITELQADAYVHFQAPYRDDTILKVSPDGEVLLEKSVNEVFIENGLFAVLVSNGAFKTRMREFDVLHVNDIEELSADLASAFPLFEAGDLMLSLRHLNMVVVVDPDTWRVKWYQMGPWLRQHDPDFHADGSITVYNNNSDDTDRGEILGGSSLMSFVPHEPDRPVSVVYGNDEDQYFFTNTQGKHQKLANGNFLVAEYFAGRVFEIDPNGDTVWQFINVFDDEHVAKLSGAKRVSRDYFDFDDWSCDAN